MCWKHHSEFKIRLTNRGDTKYVSIAVEFDEIEIMVYNLENMN
jgi:hypothetical protein